MTENLIAKIERLGVEAGLVMTPESRRFALLVRADVVAEWPKRPWLGLTDDEITELRLKTLDAVATNHEVYQAIEAKLKEKNL